MTGEEWVRGRKNSGLTQIAAAKILGITQPYLSQLENGARMARKELMTRAATIYGLPNALPLPEPERAGQVGADTLQSSLAALGYPKFAHVSAEDQHNPVAVFFLVFVLGVFVSCLVVVLPWVVCRYAVAMDWRWRLDQLILRKAQIRFGYLV